eukprot:1631150-Rhodomonas_salina.6
MPGTVIFYGATCLRVCYCAQSGCCYLPTGRIQNVTYSCSAQGICLRYCYAMRGTDVTYGATSAVGSSDQVPGHLPPRRLALSLRMLLPCGVWDVRITCYQSPGACFHVVLWTFSRYYGQTGTLLCVRYAMSGTDLPYNATIYLPRGYAVRCPPYGRAQHLCSRNLPGTARAHDAGRRNQRQENASVVQIGPRLCSLVLDSKLYVWSDPSGA